MFIFFFFFFIRFEVSTTERENMNECFHWQKKQKNTRNVVLLCLIAIRTYRQYFCLLLKQAFEDQQLEQL